MRRCPWYAVVLPLLLALSACQTPSIPLGDPLVDVVDVREMGYSVAWSTTLEIRPPQSLKYAEVLGDLLITVEEPGRLVTAVSLADGKVRWRKSVGDRMATLQPPSRWQWTLVEDDKETPFDRVVVNSESTLYQLNPENGVVEAIQPLDMAVQNAPVFHREFAIFGAANGRVFAHRMMSGFKIWDYQLSGGIVAKPVVTDAGVLVVSIGGQYAMVDADTGDVVWRGRTFDAIRGEPAVSPAAVYIASADHKMYALDRSSGADLPWVYQAPVPLTAGPILLEGNLYLPISSRKELVAIDVTNGQERWRISGDPKPLALRDQRFILLTSKGFLVVDNATGKSAIEIPTRILSRVLPGPDGSLLMISAVGQVTRIDPMP